MVCRTCWQFVINYPHVTSLNRHAALFLIVLASSAVANFQRGTSRMGRSSALASASQVIRSQSKMGNHASSKAQSKLGSHQQSAVRAQSKLGHLGQGAVVDGQNDTLGGRISEITEEEDEEVICCKIMTHIYVVGSYNYFRNMSHSVFILAP